MEEKNCRERFSQVILSARGAFFFLEHCSIDSCAVLSPVDAAVRMMRRPQAKISAKTAIPMVFLLLISLISPI